MFCSCTVTFHYTANHSVPNLRYKTDVDVAEILWSHCELELSKRFNKWHSFDVSNGTTKLNKKKIPHR